MKKGFPIEVRIAVTEINNGYCCVEGCLEKATDHHHKLPQSNYNQKRFPLFINSPMNDAFCCSEHHKNCRQYPELNISEDEAEVYEEWLQKVKQGEIG